MEKSTLQDISYLETRIKRAEEYEKQGNFEEAAKKYALVGGEYERCGEVTLAAKQYGRAAGCYQKIGYAGKSGELLSKAGSIEKPATGQIGIVVKPKTVPSKPANESVTEFINRHKILFIFIISLGVFSVLLFFANIGKEVYIMVVASAITTIVSLLKLIKVI